MHICIHVAHIAVTKSRPDFAMYASVPFLALECQRTAERKILRLPRGAGLAKVLGGDQVLDLLRL